MSLPTILTMRIERIERSKHKAGRVLLFLEDGRLVKATEQELLDFSLRPGDAVTEERLAAIETAASSSGTKAEAAALIGRKAMSSRDLQRKLTEKGASAAESRYAAEWLTAIGALDDGAYAATLCRHYSQRGYGAGYIRGKLREKGVPQELWDEALEELDSPEEQALRFLESKLRGRKPDERERKRLSDSLLRRGFSWSVVRAAFGRLGAEIEGEELP